jgi:hypothetical protein
MIQSQYFTCLSGYVIVDRLLLIMNKEWNRISNLMSVAELIRGLSDEGRGRFLILSSKGGADKERKIDR